MSPSRLSLCGLAILLGAFTLLGDDANPVIAIVGGSIRSQAEAGDYVGTIVIRHGKIAEAGPNVKAPAGAKIIDATGFVVTPGLIDAHGVLGLNGAAASEGGREASLNILDAVDPFADDWRGAARQGVTAVYVQPAATGSLGGGGAVLRVGPADDPAGLSLRHPAGIQCVLGMPASATPAQANPAAEFFRQRGLPAPAIPTQPETPPSNNSLTRFAQYEQLRGQFDAAKKYGEGKPERREAPRELLLAAIRGTIHARLEVYTDDDIRNALRLTAEFGVPIVFERVDRARSIPEELRSSRAGLVLAGRTSAEVRRLALDGRRFAIGSFGTEARATAGLRFQAAALVSSGVPRDRVLKALTSDAADMLGVGEKLGRIAAGRSADLAVFAGDPLDPSTPVRFTMCQGHITHDEPASADSLPGPSKVEVPDQFPARFVLKTTRLLNAWGIFQPGELYIVDGRINTGTGRDSQAPTIDLGDAPVTPGFVNAHLAVATELSPDADAAHLRAMDGFAVDDARVRTCLGQGFLTVLAMPGANNVIAGWSSAIRGDSSSDAGVKFSLAAPARTSERFPISLAGQFDLIESRLRSTPAQSNMYLPPAVREALFTQRDQAIQAVRAQRATAYFEAQTRTEIQAALRLIAEHRLRGVILQPRELDNIMDSIREAGVGVVIGPIRAQDGDRLGKAIVALAQAGVPLALGGEASDLRATAAWLANIGMARSAARRVMLAQPAHAFGLSASTGQLASGNPADFVIWNGDPLNVTCRPIAVVVGGRKQVLPAADDGSVPASRGTTGAAPGRTGRRGR